MWFPTWEIAVLAIITVGVSYLIGACVVLYHVRKVVPEGSGVVSPERMPPYRVSTAYQVSIPIRELHAGLHVVCPECGAEALKCNGCGVVRTDVESDRVHCRPVGSSWGYYKSHVGVPLRFTHGTQDHYCSPHHRVIMLDGLRLRRCVDPGVHVHQKCQKCGWRGVGLVIVD